MEMLQLKQNLEETKDELAKLNENVKVRELTKLKKELEDEITKLTQRLEEVNSVSAQYQMLQPELQFSNLKGFWCTPYQGCIL